ncbi:MAG: acyl-CoA desaturase [Sulfurovum sp.]|nr:acyl-CoA desaturase [Sulfurovum sp.]
MSIAKYPDVFDALKAEVKEAGLLQRVPIRGSVEMAGVILSMIIVDVLAFNWSHFTSNTWTPYALGFFMAIIFTRAVFISHDILHLQYFKKKSLSFYLSYPFSVLILSYSSSWWDIKHNINHHTWCNIPQKDEDILEMDGAFTIHQKGNRAWLRAIKYFVFWGAMFFMHIAFIWRSYGFVISHKKWGEFGLMLLHWPLIWGPIFYFLPPTDALTVYLTLNFTLSLWLGLGFVPNHFGCEVFEEEESKSLSWMELQMRTSRSLSGGAFSHWFFGGLNTQIEHHLFPKAPRFHLLKVKKITKRFAQKHNIYYFEATPIEAYIQINDVLKKY